MKMLASHSLRCMVSCRLFMILLLMQTVEGDEFFNQQQACENNNGQYIKRNGQEPAKCENAVLDIVTKTNTQAQVACVNSFAYGILESKKGDPTKCTYEIVADCPAKFFPMYDICFHVLNGPKMDSKQADQECAKLGATKIEITGNHVPKYLFQAQIEHASFWVVVNKESRINKISRSRNTDEIIMRLYPDALEETKPGHMYESEGGEKAHVICQKPAIYNVNLFGELVNQLSDFNQMCQLQQKRIWCVSQNVYQMEQKSTGTGHRTNFHASCSNIMKPMKYTSVLAKNTMAALPYRRDNIIHGIPSLGDLEPSTVGKKFGRNILFSPIYRKGSADKSCTIQSSDASEFEVEVTTLVIKGADQREFWASEHPKKMCDVMNGALMSENKIYEVPFTAREPLICNTMFDICAMDGKVEDNCHRCKIVNYVLDCHCNADERDVSKIFNKPRGSVCSCGSSKPIHIYFVLDGSGSIYDNEWNDMMTFTKNFLLSVQYDVTYVTMIQFSDTTDIRVTDANTKITKNTDINAIIRNLNHQFQSYTDIGAGLRAAEHEMKSSPASSGKKIVVLVTDGYGEGDPVSAANSIKNNYQATILSVGVGNGYNFNQIKDIAGSPSNVYTLAAFKDMNDRLLKWIFDTGC